MNTQSPFCYSNDNKRYHTWSYHLKKIFGCKVAKLSLDGGFTCPNRDGTKGSGGCTFCSSRGSGDFAGSKVLAIQEQMQQQRVLLQKKWPVCKYLAYFQAYTGTYAPAEKLNILYETALAQPDVVGLCIATRADCLEKDVVDYLADLNKRTYLVVELGLQTKHDTTANSINRCHTYHDFLQGYKSLQNAGIQVCVHLINYLPGESRQEMLETAYAVGALRPHSVKLHMLHILRGTAIQQQWTSGELQLPDMEEYINLVCDQLEVMPSTTVIQRLTSDAPATDLLGPTWLPQKRRVLNGIDKALATRNSWQGRRYSGIL